ncbi:hypothetical protein CWO07_26445 [Vibrio splendidus]|uniref:Uncharacterized protein n=1 Tax=Vibrio splendidus TaxID=29497 RepID=A0A2T5E1T6_VIBSP|nr:hypothetical protein CWO07_26445 [Vibrio splendidus]
MKKFKKTFEDNKGKKSTRKGRNKGDLGNCEGFLPSCQHGMGQKCFRPVALRRSCPKPILVT